MNTSWFTHLPAVAIDAINGEAVGPGRLERLPFAEWRSLDPAFPWAESKYTATGPVFFVGEADLPDDPDVAYAATRRFIDRLHLAMLLDLDAPLLPAPTLSTTYIRRNTEFKPTRSYIGPFEREWVVFGRPPQVTYDEAGLRKVRAAYSLLERAERKGLPAGVEAGCHALVLTMRPEFWFNDLGVDRVNSFVHAMAAAEGLLLPPRSEARGGPGLTVTFGRHAAVLASPSREDLSDRADDLSSLYRLRSRLVHGEMNPNSLEAGDVERLRLGLSFFRFALIRILGLGNTGRLDGTSLPVVLARAWLDPAAHASLFKAPEGP